ncbi:MAG: cupin [Micrococcales bacterium]|nr:cupin [Micrococcales bacterium]
MSTQVLARGSVPLAHAPLPTDQAVAGKPTTGLSVFQESGLDVGLWEHSVGVSRDVEDDEIFVILNGLARIEVANGPTLNVGPGDVVQLAAGDHTTWYVTEPLRKFWVSVST